MYTYTDASVQMHFHWEQVQEVVHELSKVMLQHIDLLKAQVQNLKYPRGTRENPALSCREIALGHPHYKTGF